MRGFTTGVISVGFCATGTGAILRIDVSPETVGLGVVIAGMVIGAIDGSFFGVVTVVMGVDCGLAVSPFFGSTLPV